MPPQYIATHRTCNIILHKKIYLNKNLKMLSQQCMGVFIRFQGEKTKRLFSFKKEGGKNSNLDQST